MNIDEKKYDILRER